MALALALPAAALGQTVGRLPAQNDLFDDAEGNKQLETVARYIQTVCPRLGRLNTLSQLPSGSDIEDTFFRCNAALSSAGAGTDTTGILDQYTPQETLAMGNDREGVYGQHSQGVAARLAVLAGRLGPTSMLVGSLNDPRRAKTVVLASNDDSSAGMAGSSAASRMGGFANLRLGGGDRDRTERQVGFDFDVTGVDGGIDFLVNDTMAVGVAVGYGDSEVDFDPALDGVDGETLDLQTISGTLYTALAPTERLSFSGAVTYGQADFDTKRILDANETAGMSPTQVDRTVTAQTDANQIAIYADGYYALSQGALQFGPLFGLSYFRSKVDAFSEATVGDPNGLGWAFPEQEYESFQSILGVSGTYNMSTSFGVLAPHARASWIHEFNDGSETFVVRYAPDNLPIVDPEGMLGDVAPAQIKTDELDANRFELGGGVVTVFPNALQLSLDAATIVDQDYTSSYLVSLGLRKEF